MSALYVGQLKDAALKWLANTFKSIFLDSVKECLFTWAENHDEWRVMVAKKEHSIALLRVLHHFTVGMAQTRTVKVRLLGLWHRRASKWHHAHVSEMLTEAKAEHLRNISLHDENVVLKEENSALRKDVKVLKTQVAEGKGQMQLLKQQFQEVIIREDVTNDGDRLQEASAALEALQAEALLRQKAEATVNEFHAGYRI